MNRLLVAVAASAVLAGASHVISAQTPAARKWTVPRLPDGRPDLQGTWTTQTFTPLQRPERYAGREFLTAEEAAAHALFVEGELGPASLWSSRRRGAQ